MCRIIFKKILDERETEENQNTMPDLIPLQDNVDVPGTLIFLVYYPIIIYY